MEMFFIDVRNKQTLPDLKLGEGDALMGLNIGDDGVVTKEGVPQHRLYPALKVVSFGIQRFQKQDARNSVASVSSQAYNFRQQFPAWKIGKMYRPVYDINPDDTLASGILDPDLGPVLLEPGMKLNAILSELAQWNANRYVCSQQFRPTLLNNILNEFPFPFKDTPGHTRLQSVRDYFYDQQLWWVENLARIEPAVRVFPNIKQEILFRDNNSAMILVETEKYGADDLAAQLYFQSNPDCVRVILVRKINGTNKHAVSVVNALLFDPNMVPYRYPNIKELNLLEKKGEGDPSWKNLKLSATGPRKGTVLAFDVIWAATKVNE